MKRGDHPRALFVFVFVLFLFRILIMLTYKTVDFASPRSADLAIAGLSLRCASGQTDKQTEEHTQMKTQKR